MSRVGAQGDPLSAPMFRVGRADGNRQTFRGSCVGAPLFEALVFLHSAPSAWGS